MSLGVWIFAVAEVLFVLGFFAVLRWADRRTTPPPSGPPGPPPPMTPGAEHIGRCDLDSYIASLKRAGAERFPARREDLDVPE